MSLLTETSPKHCANRGFQPKKFFNKKLIYFIFVFISSIFLILFIAYYIYHPSKPQFYLKDTSISNLSLSSSPRALLNSTIQVTILSQNANARIGIYYDDMKAYVIYKGEQITEDSLVPPFYQGHEDTNVMTTALHGVSMPIAPSIGYEVNRDQSEGKIVFSVRISGRLRWKVLGLVSNKYRFEVNCVVMIGVGRNSESSMQGTQCSTSV